MKLNAQALVCAAVGQVIALFSTLALFSTQALAQPAPPESPPTAAPAPPVAPAPATPPPAPVQAPPPPAPPDIEQDDVEIDATRESEAPSASEAAQPVPEAVPNPGVRPADTDPAPGNTVSPPATTGTGALGAPSSAANSEVAAPATTEATAGPDTSPANPHSPAATPVAAAPTALQAATESSNRGAQFDLRPYSRPLLRGFGYGGFVQAQYLESQLSEDQLQQGNTPFNRNQFALRSARLRLEQGYEFTAYGIEFDASTMRPELLSIRRAEATLLYRGDNDELIAPLIALTVGVVDLPFGFEVAESVRTRVFMERSTISTALFPTQNDVGIRLFGAWRFARYAFALVNGEPFGGSDWPTDPNRAKDLLGRLGGEGHITDGIHLAGGASFAFGKGFHAGRPAVKDTLFWRDDNHDGVATATEIVGVPGSSASASANFERFALSADLEFQVETPIGASRAYGELFVASNHDRGLVVSNPVVTGVDVRQWGGYLAVSQDLTQYGFVALRVDLYNPNADIFDQRRGSFVPASQRIITWSPAVGLILPRRARFLAQYDWVDDYLARDLLGVPTDAKNNQWTLRLQVEL